MKKEHYTQANGSMFPISSDDLEKDAFREKLSSSGLIYSEDMPDITAEAVEIDWGEYKEAVCHGIFPLWNVQQITFHSVDFTASSVNGIYKHIFSLDDIENRDGYLIEMNQNIMEIRREKEQIVLQYIQKTFENWIAVRIILISPNIFQYDVFCNFLTSVGNQ